MENKLGRIALLRYMGIRIHNKVIKNASWIIVGRIAQSIVGMLIAMITARFLGPSNYGLINYASSIVAFAVPIMQLGLSNILVQELVNNKEKEGEIIGTAIGMSIISGILSILGILAFVAIANKGEAETFIVCALSSIVMVFYSLEMIIYWYQAKLLSKYTSIVSLIAYFIVALYRLFLLITQKSIYWFALSMTFDYAIITITLIVLYKKLGGQIFSFSMSTARRMFHKSKHYILSSMMVTIFAQTDRIMIKLMLGDADTGFYSVAVTCAGMTSFIFGAIIDSARPSIFESKKSGNGPFARNIARLYNIIIYFALIQSIVIAAFSKIIIGILYGAQFYPAVGALRIVVWYTTFSYIGSVRNIWILAENKQKYLWIINLCGAAANVVMNAMMIPLLGINGAAIASLVTQFFTNVITGYIFSPIRENNRLMVHGLNPNNLKEIFKLMRGGL